MWFDASAALVSLAGERGTKPHPPATSTTLATSPGDVANVAGVAAPPAETAKPAIQVLPAPSMRDRAPDAFRYGMSVAGHPLTWTGRIMPLRDWRNLSEWERHGPDGRIWCGIAREWIEQKGL